MDSALTAVCDIMGQHDYEFAGVTEGKCYWVCTRCPSYIEELEDSQP